MTNILLIAAREFRQIAAARSFWITLLIIPFALAIGPIASHFMQKSQTETVMLIDPAGKAPAVRQRIELEEQRRVLNALARYAERNGLDRAQPGAPWARHDHFYSDAEVMSFVQQGGAAHAQAVMRRAAQPETPAFDAPEPLYRLVPTPAAIATSTPERLARAMTALVNPPRKEEGKDKLDYAVYVPANFGTPGAAVQVWSDGPVSGGLMGALQDELTRTLRVHFLEGQGVSPAMASAAGQIAPLIAVNKPPPGHGQEQVVIRSILPLLTSYILLMSLMLSGSWMLQGTVEERSNKLIETVLACVSPNELMYGKLVGTVAVGLTMVAFWVMCAIGAAFATQGMIAEFLRPALAPLSSPGVALAMTYYFVAGYLMISMIFLAIGAMSDSFRDAQAYLSPVLLVIAMPFAIIAQAILRDPSSLAVRIMSWIPIYTPFTMLARMGAGVPLWELIGCGVMLALFVALEVVLLGRVFRASLLSAGSKPGLARIARLMTGRDAE
ncbi:ABC transporter permease [Sphingomonas crusticola]|uniref:ABC transporter permease n=1 Tax=Sphingomonas crusticola TaxID=1697973 RepID=UPI000E24A891|nr:ABC transporter permease [Sphingomonas crusticola]